MSYLLDYPEEERVTDSSKFYNIPFSYSLKEYLETKDIEPLNSKTIAFVGIAYESLLKPLQDVGIKTKILPITHKVKRKMLKDVDIVHGVYFHNAWAWFILAKLMRKKTLCYWVGSDYLLAKSSWIRRLQLKVTDKFIDKHVANSERMVEELKEIDINASNLPIAVDTKVEKLPLPEKFAVLYYVLEGKEKLYCLDHILAVSKELHEIDFYIVGMNHHSFQMNLHYRGWVDMAEMWAKTNVLVRFTTHDAYPRMGLEALSKGRHVIHNYPLQGLIYSQDVGETVEELKELIENPQLNEEGIELVQTVFSFDTYVLNVLKLYSKLLGGKT